MESSAAEIIYSLYLLVVHVVNGARAIRGHELVGGWIDADEEQVSFCKGSSQSSVGGVNPRHIAGREA